jgi:hypothetical protein
LVDLLAWIGEEALRKRKVAEVLIREEEMKVARVQNLDPLPDTPCHGRHLLDDSYLIQQ